MRSTVVIGLWLSLVIAASALAAVPHLRGTGGQCRGSTGSVVKCGPGASTDAEGVPLASKAAVMRLSQAGQTDAPVRAIARCRDRTYSTAHARSRAWAVE